MVGPNRAMVASHMDIVQVVPRNEWPREGEKNSWNGSAVGHSSIEDCAGTDVGASVPAFASEGGSPKVNFNTESPSDSGFGITPGAKVGREPKSIWFSLHPICSAAASTAPSGHCVHPRRWALNPKTD